MGKYQIPNWEIGIVLPLPKKGYIREYKNYRGTRLIRIMLKIYEQILEKRLIKTIDQQLEESQSGFRKRGGGVFNMGICIYNETIHRKEH